mmetsp:Transcript_45029/g.118038  ORF Transcript_45029/g.118038 Transcript_45029/m.118038 type:complete len:90 (+) Transcript_45029:104-373(+)
MMFLGSDLPMPLFLSLSLSDASSVQSLRIIGIAIELVEDLAAECAIRRASGRIDPRDPQGDPKEVWLGVRIEMQHVNQAYLRHGADDSQ